MNYEPLFRYIEYNLKADNVLTFTQKIKMRQILSDIHKMTEDEAGELFDREADEWIADNSLETKRDVMSRSTFIKVMTEGGGNQDWISVEERLPDEFVSVLTQQRRTNGDIIYEVTYCYDNGHWWTEDQSSVVNPKVTHWMKLPESSAERGGK